MSPETLQWVIGTAAVFIVGILGAITGWRALGATKRRDAHAANDALIVHYRGSWEAEIEARRHDREERERLADRVEGLHEKVDAQRTEIEGQREQLGAVKAELELMKGRLLRLAAFIRHVLDEWAVLFPGVPHPAIWPDIVHLIDPRPNEDEKAGE